MKVLLLQSVYNLGKSGEICNVKSGYARNYLIPTKKATAATSKALEEFEKNKAVILKENEALEKKAKSLKEKIQGQYVSVVVPTSETGRLFGSINSKNVVEEINKFGKDIDLPKSSVNLSSIKESGVFQMDVMIFGDVSAKMFLAVANTESNAASLISEHKNPKAEKEMKQEDVNQA